MMKVIIPQETSKIYQQIKVLKEALSSDQEVMEWMIDTQLGRRNLTPIQRIAVVKKYEDKIKKRAKERQSDAGGDVRHKNALLQLEQSDKETPIHTDKELAKLANVGSGTMARYNVVINSDDEEIKDKIHMKAIIDLEKALITGFICDEWYKLSNDTEGKDCFTKEIIDNKNANKIIEVLKNRAYINHVYYQLAVKRLNECFNDEEQLIKPQELVSYYSDMMDLVESVIEIDDMEYRLANIV